MRWFNGSVSEAVAKSKANRSVFVAYIRGDDENSKQMDDVLNKEEVKLECEHDCTAIKLHVNSTEAKQFASIFPVVYVPCIYFIDGEGIPLEVIGGTVTTEQLIAKARETILKHRVKFPKLDADLSSATATMVTSVATTSDAQNNEATSPGDDVAKRVEKGKQLIERMRVEKKEKEDEEARNKEKQRREDGKAMTKANVERENMLAQQMAERIRLEKAKEKAARESVRQKIAQDKAERAARQELEKKKRMETAARIDPQSHTSSITKEYNETRIQFRLRDGSSVTQSFPSDSPLETGRQFICTNANLTKKITFWTTFPRQHFGNDEVYTKTFKELGLVPSAALIVDSSAGEASTASGITSNTSSILTLILAPFLALLSFIKIFLFGSPEAQSTTTQRVPEASVPPSSMVRQRKRNNQSESMFNKKGKVHSFHQENNDDDDDNKTWNGNSTQQM